MNDGKITFWRLLESHKLVIPMLQRDYAQGRDDPRSKEIRTEFVHAILTAIVGQKNLDLGLIYGMANNTDLVLIDGQQRATTLYLIYWYFAVRANSVSDFKQLSKFSYETRTTSRDFCRVLTEEQNVKDLNMIKGAGSLSSKIKDAAWFFLTWERDPTIKSMLNMLDCIHETGAKVSIEKFDCADIWARLTDETVCPLTFQFLSMKNHGLSDDLYIRMNARGRSLTDFEKFKAWLEEHIRVKGYSKDIRNDWKHSLDKDWLDLFWKKRPEVKGVEEVDAAYFRFFKGAGLNHLVAASGEGVELEDLVSEVIKDGFMPTVSFGSIFEKNVVCETFNVLQILCDKIAELNLVESRIDFFPGKSGDYLLFQRFSYTAPVYRDRVLFHAFCRYLVEQKECCQQELCRWMRIVRNLTVNTDFDPKGFIDAICTIHRVAEKISKGDGILGYLRNEQELPGFNKNQFEEEVLKSKLIFDNAEWEPLIQEAENHKLFRGRIGFLLMDTSVTDTGKYLDAFGIDKFRQRLTIAMRLFNENGSIVNSQKDENFLLTRAVLSCCEPIILYRRDSISLENSGPNWRNLLGETNRVARIIQCGIIKLIDQWPDRDVSDVDRLEHFRANNSPKAEGNSYWMKSIIDHGDILLKHSIGKKIQRYDSEGVYLYFRTNSKDFYDILLASAPSHPSVLARNSLIGKLLKTSKWKCNENIGPVEVDDHIYYKGYHIKLDNEEDQIRLTFEWRAIAEPVVVRYIKNDEVIDRSRWGVFDSLSDVHEYTRYRYE